MNAGKAVYGILSGTTAVTDIVGTRIFPEIAEQEAVTPFIIYQLQSVAPEDTHDGPSKLDEVRFEFLCYADSYNGAADLGVAVRAALDRVSGTYNGVNVESVQFNDVDVEIEYDPRRYSQVLKFTFRIKRDNIEIALGTPVTGAQLGDLSDVNVSGVTDNQVLSYDAATDTWIPAADAGGAEQLNDLSDVNVVLPDTDEFLRYDGAEWVNDTLSISQVGGLQAALDAKAEALDELSDVKIVGTPTDGDALVYSSGFWARGTAGASTLGDLDDVNTTGAGVGSTITFNGSTWDISGAALPSDDIYYHNRYATEAETLRAGATATVELYYTAQADGDGYAESASSDTASAGNVIRRKLYYSEAAQADPDTGTWVQFADIADDTTFASAKATLLAYLKQRTGGTVPISLKMTWEDVAAASLLLDTYTGAAAAYSLRKLRTAYTGSAIRVRRASNNDEQDIGFDGSGELDTTSLASFCSGTNGFVAKWYDQASTNDATQTTTANQPKIYDSSTGVVTENGKPAVDFTRATVTVGQYLTTSNYIVEMSQNNATVLAVYNRDDGNYLLTEGDSISPVSSQFIMPFNPNVVWVNSATIGTIASGQQLNSWIYDGSNVSAFVNGSASGSATSVTVNTEVGNQSFIGTRSDEQDKFDGRIQEIITYKSNQSTNRTGIESNINTFYSIYP